ncbi:unnamed protein product [Amoebophrya sp. A120]|nr:unnamed protein product [Amoebophrya sp. A120]|eukprot:GSA120T00022290001.1
MPTFYHATPARNRHSIETSGFRPGSGGYDGPGIYFCKRPEAAINRARVRGEDVVVFACDIDNAYVTNVNNQDNFKVTESDADEIEIFDTIRYSKTEVNEIKRDKSSVLATGRGGPARGRSQKLNRFGRRRSRSRSSSLFSSSSRKRHVRRTEIRYDPGARRVEVNQNLQNRIPRWNYATSAPSTRASGILNTTSHLFNTSTTSPRTTRVQPEPPNDFDLFDYPEPEQGTSFAGYLGTALLLGALGLLVVGMCG